MLVLCYALQNWNVGKFRCRLDVSVLDVEYGVRAAGAALVVCTICDCTPIHKFIPFSQ